MSADNRESYVRSAGERAAPSSAEALLAASYNSIAADEKLDQTARLTAANALTGLDRQAAALCLFSIAAKYPNGPIINDTNLAFNVRLRALQALIQIDGKLAINAIYSMAMNEPTTSAQMGALQQVSRIPNTDVQAAAKMLHSVATASIDANVRLSAAGLLQQLLQKGSS